MLGRSAKFRATPLADMAPAAVNWRHWFLLAVAIGACVFALSTERIAQDPRYHAFADQDSRFGIPNGLNVLSNVPFLLVGLFGLARAAAWQRRSQRRAFVVFSIGVAAIAAGSAYYHWRPSTDTLVWDRLPITVAFMALFCAVIEDRVSAALGRRLLLPAVCAGLLAVVYWYVTELRGVGDLRLYAVVQFLPMLLLPIVLLLFRAGALRSDPLWGALGLYGLAKVAEHFDGQILAATADLSGHALKHLLAAVAVLVGLYAVPYSSSRSPSSGNGPERVRPRACGNSQK